MDRTGERGAISQTPLETEHPLCLLRWSVPRGWSAFRPDFQVLRQHYHVLTSGGPVSICFQL